MDILKRYFIRQVLRTAVGVILCAVLTFCSSSQWENPPPKPPVHPAGWVLDGHTTAAEEDISSCQSCHGEDFAGGTSGIACTDCHMGSQTAIHPLPWGDDTVEEHGPYAFQNGIEACSNQYCHGAELQGVVDSGPSCSDCHQWPTGHQGGWLPLEHAVEAQTNIASCTTCHGDHFTGGISGVACTDCHMGSETAIHPVSWGTNALSYHGMYVLEQGIEACSNQYCHGVDLQGVPDSGPSCSACHDWPVGHSTDLHHERFGALGFQCTDCHQARWDEGCSCYVYIVIKDCQDCHFSLQSASKKTFRKARSLSFP